MNGNFYPNPTFPNNAPINYNEPIKETPSNLNFEQSYIENILRMNLGKTAKVFVSYPESSAWQNKEYIGIIEAAGKDHLIIRDSSTGSWYLIRMIYLDYVEFTEQINYQYPIK